MVQKLQRSNSPVRPQRAIATFDQPQNAFAARAFERANVILPGYALDGDGNPFNAAGVAARCRS